MIKKLKRSPFFWLTMIYFVAQLIVISGLLDLLVPDGSFNK